MEIIYPAHNSRTTQLTAEIHAAETVIAVADPAVFPPGPNYATIGRENDAEVVLYEAVDAQRGSLTGVRRAKSYTSAKSWPAGTEVYHCIAADNINAVMENVEENSTGLEMIVSKIGSSDGIATLDDCGRLAQRMPDMPDVQWTELAYINGATAGFQAYPLRITKWNGMVFITGYVNPNTADIIQFAKIPAGYRPLRECNGVAPAQSNVKARRVVVYGDGISLYGAVDGTAAPVSGNYGIDLCYIPAQ